MGQPNIRERILDAAESCYLEIGPSKTLHRQIAERAGVSRPTVYKYAGDQDAVARALLDRELDRFFEAVEEVIESADTVRSRVVEALVFTVVYAREHALFQRLLRDEPHVVLPWLTTDATPVLRRVIDVAQPHLSEALRRQEIRKVRPDVVAEWMGRLAISLILTPSVSADLDRPVTLRRFVDDLFVAGLGPSDAGSR